MNNQNNQGASSNVEVLTRLCELVEQACIDIAPTYAEYMPMAFAIANDCGEAGRSLFHRLCRISHKYNPTMPTRFSPMLSRAETVPTG
jgi:hypothetical protein